MPFVEPDWYYAREFLLTSKWKYLLTAISSAFTGSTFLINVKNKKTKISFIYSFDNEE